MTETEFKQQIKRLSPFLGFPKDEFALKELFQTFKKCEIIPFTKAISEIYNGEEYFPAPKTIWAKYYKYRDEISPKTNYLSLTCECGQTWSLIYPLSEFIQMKCCDKTYSRNEITSKIQTSSTGTKYIDLFNKE